MTPSPWRKSPRFVVAAVAVAVALSGCTSGGSAAVDTPSSSGADATVVRVVDGDTLVASLDGTVETIRLLNVDTPETKKPNTPVQCLGPEATEYLRQRLPAGTGVHLEYDVERTDRYDRTLAGVYLDGDLVNADIAREGLGVAVLFEPNHRFHDEVLAAQQEALEEETGLFSATVECTVPAQIESAIDQLATVPTATAQTSAEASGLLSGAATALAAGKAADLLLGRTDDSGDAVRAVVGSVVAGKLAPRLSKATAAATRQEGILTERRQLLVTREHEAAVKAKAKAKAEARRQPGRRRPGSPNDNGWPARLPRPRKPARQRSGERGRRRRRLLLRLRPPGRCRRRPAPPIRDIPDLVATRPVAGPGSPAPEPSLTTEPAGPRRPWTKPGGTRG
ncbi:MAG: thermonuclease family protein [Micrococcaceae bacterium]|nr:thermonuclease family protein [Micrococcaceae bacterium]